MKIFNTSQIRAIDAYTIAHEPVSSVDLMERAARGCAQWVGEHFKKSSDIKVFAGPGNNGGDGWALARILSDEGFKNISIYFLTLNGSISNDAEINRKRLTELTNVPVKAINGESDIPDIHSYELIIDALFGSGLNRPVEGLAATLIRHINSSGCKVLSIDIPSGLSGEQSGNEDNFIAVHADDTLTFDFPKKSFFYAENEKYTGNWHIIPIGLHPRIINDEQTDYYYITLFDIQKKIITRTKFSHKGTYGHALLIAGSYGMAGAAILAARACLRTGSGLLTTHVSRKCYPIIQQCVPESVFSIDPSDDRYTVNPEVNNFSAVAAGPGIGKDDASKEALGILVTTCKKPLILDADALNIISTNKDFLDLLPENTILTPHPGEFDRLFGKSANSTLRNNLQMECSKKYRLIIVLKGACTSVSLPDGRCFFNSTGNPGMATGGSGDVLTGMILSLLAQGMVPEDAVISAVFIHGKAGDMAAKKFGEQALIASDIIDNIGKTFKTLKKNETTHQYPDSDLF